MFIAFQLIAASVQKILQTIINSSATHVRHLLAHLHNIHFKKKTALKNIAKYNVKSIETVKVNEE